MPKLDFSKVEVAKPTAITDLVPEEISTREVTAFFNKYNARIEAYGKACDSLATKKQWTEDDNIEATKLITNGKAAEKEIKASGTLAMKPYKAFVSTVTGLVKNISGGISGHYNTLISRQGQYDRELRIEAERKRLAFEKEQARREAELKSKIRKLEEDTGKKIDIPMPATPPPPKVGSPDPVRTSMGTKYTQKKLIVEIEDEAKIPREYLVPDMPKINAAAKSGKQIPGVKIYWDEVVRYRTA